MDIYKSSLIFNKTIYKSDKINVIVTCPKHGDFFIRPDLLLNGQGCKLCNKDKKLQLLQVDFINKAILIHGNKYDYSKVEYINEKTPVCIICPEHGEFYQTPNKHLNGHGCKLCRISHLELNIKNMLDNNNIFYYYNARSKIIPELKGLELDFYLPKHKIAIECLGLQHFIPIDFSGKLSNIQKLNNFNNIIKRDKQKYNLCLDNNIKLLYYSNLNIQYPYKIYDNINDILNEILH